MARLFLLLVYLSLPNGHWSEDEVIYGIGIKLCSLKCSQRGSCMSFAYDIEQLACHLSHKPERSWKTGGLVIYPKKRDQASAGACSQVNCNSNTRCVDRRRGDAVCVEDHTVSRTLGSRCSTDTDCPAKRNFVCSTNGCTCVPGYNFNPANNSCVRRPKVRSPLEARCSKDTDCPADRKFACFNKTCKCEPGYSFNPANNSCVRRCETYGKGFTTYRGLGTMDRTMELVKGTLKGCREKCVRMESFICISYTHVMLINYCYFFKLGYLDIPPSQRVETKVKGVKFKNSFNTRNCE